MDHNCIFCQIANGEIPSATIYEDELFRVILDLGPASKGHALILPKSHARNLCEADRAVTEKLFPLAGKIGAAMEKSMNASGFNVVQNNGASAGQTVFHLHVHVIPRYDNGPSIVTWEPQDADAETLSQIADQIRAVL